MRRWVAEALTVALAAGGIQGVAVADPAWACGCGAYIPAGNGTASVAREQALVRFDGTTEDVVMRFSVHSDSSDAAWVMPVPSTAKASLASPDLFGQLAAAEQPLTKVRHHLWPHLNFSDSASAPRSRGAGATGGGGVQVLADQRLGAFEVANLAASDPAALGTWLTEHDFTLKPGTADRLSAYTAEGWQFVAVRLASGTSATLNGALDPIRITFAAKDAVYPMRLSAGATTPQSVTVAILAPHRMDADRTPVAAEPASSVLGDWVDPSHTGPALADLAAGRMFLTVFDGYFYPPSQITQDYGFRQATADWVQHPVVYKEELLTFLGIPVFLLVLLGVLIVIGWAVWRRRLSARTRSPATPGPR